MVAAARSRARRWLSACICRNMPAWGVDRRVGPKPWVWGVGGVVLLVVVQATTRAHTLTEQDSINLVDGLADFNPALHQPHPPGYPLVILAGHALSWLGDSVDALLGVALVASAVALVATYLLGRAMFGRSADWSPRRCLPRLRSSSTTWTSRPSIRRRRRRRRSSRLIAYRVATRRRRPMVAGAVPRPRTGGRLPADDHRADAAGMRRGDLARAPAAEAPPARSRTRSGDSGRVGDTHDHRKRRLGRVLDGELGPLRPSLRANVAAERSLALRRRDQRGMVRRGGPMVSLPPLVLLALLSLRGGRPTVPRNRAAWTILAAWVLPIPGAEHLRPLRQARLRDGRRSRASRRRRRSDHVVSTARAARARRTRRDPARLLHRAQPLAAAPASAFFPTADSIDVADVEARGLERVAATCPPPRCTLFSLPPSDRLVAARPPRHRGRVRIRADDLPGLRLSQSRAPAERRGAVGRRAGADVRPAARRARGDDRALVGIPLDAPETERILQEGVSVDEP